MPPSEMDGYRPFWLNRPRSWDNSAHEAIAQSVLGHHVKVRRQFIVRLHHHAAVDSAANIDGYLIRLVKR